MDPLQRIVATLNKLLLRDSPTKFNSTWILERSPSCYRIIRKHIRSEVGGIDWDKITHALEPKYQRLWMPRQKRQFRPYRNYKEIRAILTKYESKLYVFVAPADTEDLQIREKIAVALVRVAQAGNLLARAELVELIRYTIYGWIDKYCCLSRWQGHEDEIHKQLDGCIRRYRYTGSFLRYVFRTLEYAARGICSPYACSLDDPIAHDACDRRIVNVIHDPETNQIVSYKPRRTWSFDSESQIDGL